MCSWVWPRGAGEVGGLGGCLGLGVPREWGRGSQGCVCEPSPSPPPLPFLGMDPGPCWGRPAWEWGRSSWQPPGRVWGWLCPSMALCLPPPPLRGQAWGQCCSFEAH